MPKQVEQLKQKYRQPIQRIIDTFADNPHMGEEVYAEFTLEDDIQFNIYDKAEAVEKEQPHRFIEPYFLLRFSELHCFKLVFHAKNDITNIWNPFYETFSAFTSRVKDYEYYEDYQNYLTSEIIVKWMKSHV